MRLNRKDSNATLDEPHDYSKDKGHRERSQGCKASCSQVSSGPPSTHTAIDIYLYDAL
jgi:hypothetical protein